MTEIKRYVRFSHGDIVGFGRLNDENIIEVQDGNFFNSSRDTGVSLPLNDVELLNPVIPRSIFCVGRNYRSHAGDAGAEQPGIFTKLITSITGPNSPIPYAKDASDLHYEGEMVVVIGKHCKHVSKEEASDYVFGVTCGNDMSERNWQKNDLQWVRAKASDGFGPIGPYLVTGLDYNNLQLETRLNGETVQSERTNMLIHDVETVISFISQTISLHPGDIIFTGTPGQTQAIQPGDTIEVELEGVGTLKNEVVAIE